MARKKKGHLTNAVLNERGRALNNQRLQVSHIQKQIQCYRAMRTLLVIEGHKFNNELNISVYIRNKEPDYNNN